MNTKVRMTLQAMRNPMKNDKELENVERQGNRLMVLEKSTRSQRRSSREKKMALIQDVDKLKRKLRHEENVHRALERAFTRPLGALPRLPPYLPPYTLELLAEVAVLEEEVVRLEEQVVNFRQGLYEEAAYISSSKKNMDNLTDSCNTSIRNPMIDGPKSLSQVDIASETLAQEPISVQVENYSDQPTIVKQSPKKAKSNSTTSYDGRGKENQSCSNSFKQNKQSPKQSFPNVRTPVKKPMEKHLDPLKVRLECRTVNDGIIEGNCLANPCERLAGGECSSPNKVSEDILKCLISIFLRMSTRKSRVIELMLSSLSGLPSSGIDEDNESQDPYGTCKEFGMRDIGPYNHLCMIEAKFMNSNRTANSLFLIQRLRILKGKLGSVDLQGLTHHQKLAFWINIYNCCMMNAFLDHGIPETPQMVITLMQTATINVSGHMLNAMTIEHFILRLPHHSKYVSSIVQPLLSSQQTSAKGAKNEEMMARSVFALDFSEPLVTFALSCGSWSSPAVRVYTASDVENELEAAKREYLQAAIGISTEDKIVIPKLLDWYLHDFAKDLDSFLDWLFLQLPSELRKELMNCVERGNRKHLLQSIEVMPYDFSFRLLLQQ